MNFKRIVCIETPKVCVYRKFDETKQVYTCVHPNTTFLFENGRTCSNDENFEFGCPLEIYMVGLRESRYFDYVKVHSIVDEKHPYAIICCMDSDREFTKHIAYKDGEWHIEKKVLTCANELITFENCGLCYSDWDTPIALVFNTKEDFENEHVSEEIDVYKTMYRNEHMEDDSKNN